ncbi:glycosyltransferases group 1 [Bordetella bronchiseptica 99-R-0433]|uniref:glycosyltransferase n=1 Tax=Bordetella bronchiseptica TaxID=518 RepID=UPI00045A0084|nr:glycosyltransferase [Bordetella bronchiseptica]KCV61302.1 glycosyltransferases group 1 [Bordetella bronchiseptica 99-R-0433]
MSDAIMAGLCWRGDMRIAYLTFELPDTRTGVGKKILAQANFWRAAGNQVRHFVLRSPAPSALGEVEFLCQRRPGGPMVGAMLSSGRISDFLQAWRPDVIYARQMLWWPGALRALRGAPLIIEYNSIARNEYRSSSKIKYLLEIISSKYFPRQARGIIAVTPELLATVPATQAEGVVISNGYDFTAAVPRAAPINTRARLLLVGSPGQPWLGADKMVRLATLMPEYDFDVVVPGLKLAGPPNLYFHGALFDEDLAARYAATDVALGTLALHRKGMEQAAPLKTREYLAHGIPVVGGYDDPDLDGAAYWLNIGNTEDNIDRNIENVRNFVTQWRGRLPDRGDIESRLGFSGKECARLDFFERVRQHAG